MLKKLICVVIVLFLLIFAVSAESVFKSEVDFLYLYMPECGYCERFNPNYRELQNKYGKKYKFLKVNVYTKEGQLYVRKYGIYAVPQVVVFNRVKNKVGFVSVPCMLNYSCIDSEFAKFVE